MNTIQASKIAEIAGVPVTAGGPGVAVTGGVCTDTRKLVPGCAFFALKGGNFDGDDYAADALAKGAAVAVVRTWKGGEVPDGAAVIETPDPLLALQRLACWWRKQLDIPVVCITGSNGKTSTKDFTTAVLSQRFKVSATKGNLNNHIGVPLTVLSTSQEDEAAVWEIGMNHSGELAPLCEIIRPKYGIITNIGSAHIEFLGSRDGIAEEKATLARALPTDGVLFFPAACDYHEYLRQRSKAHIVPVGNGRGLVRAEQPHFEADHSSFLLTIEGVGSVPVRLPVPGRHMVTNALLAAAVGWKLGLSLEEIAAGLESAVLTGGRLALYESRGVHVIDDTYNANPESMAAAIETLADTPVVNGGRRIIVLGMMGELGAHGPSAHQRAGQLAAKRRLRVVAVGAGAEGIASGAGDAPHFPDHQAAADWLAREARAGDVVLFKGSRTAAVERVMNSAFPRP